MLIILKTGSSLPGFWKGLTEVFLSLCRNILDQIHQLIALRNILCHAKEMLPQWFTLLENINYLGEDEVFLFFYVLSRKSTALILMLHDFSPVLCGFMCALGDDSRQSLWMEPMTVWLISNISNRANFVTKSPILWNTFTNGRSAQLYLLHVSHGNNFTALEVVDLLCCFII